ncbi:MAG: hypothetical protein AB1896_13645 [Thermodesulfobacteriota bacterium]
MDWFKHMVSSHEDPDISDAWDLFRDKGVVVFWVTLEIYGREFRRLEDGFLWVLKTYLSRKLRCQWPTVEKIFTHYASRGRFEIKTDGNWVGIKINKFLELASTWTRRAEKETQAADQGEPPVEKSAQEAPQEPVEETPGEQSGVEAPVEAQAGEESSEPAGNEPTPSNAPTLEEVEAILGEQVRLFPDGKKKPKTKPPNVQPLHTFHSLPQDHKDKIDGLAQQLAGLFPQGSWRNPYQVVGHLLNRHIRPEAVARIFEFWTEQRELEVPYIMAAAEQINKRLNFQESLAEHRERKRL